jgi:hypothetical protein
VGETKGGKIHADEVWSFPEPPKVVLIDIRPLCVNCHEAKDYADLLRRIMTGKASASRTSAVLSHYCDVNGCSVEDFDKDVKAAFVAQREAEARYHYGFNLNVEVDYGKWGRPADAPLLTPKEKKLVKQLFYDRDDPIFIGERSLSSFAAAVRYLQSLKLDQRDISIALMQEEVANERDDDEVMSERDDGIDFV